MGKKLTTEEFIERARKVHGDKYDYSLVNYVNNSTEVEIVCNIHGIFKQRPQKHMNGQKCGFCAKNRKMDTEAFVNKAIKIHGDIYDYSDVNYVSSTVHVDIGCRKHKKLFSMRPADHLQKQGCPNCGLESRTNKRRRHIEEFLLLAKQIHGDRYDYTRVSYTNARTNIEIRCKKCGDVFLQMPEKHLRGRGCSFCNSSKGENRVSLALEYYNIAYQYQKRFKNAEIYTHYPLIFTYQSTICV